MPVRPLFLLAALLCTSVAAQRTPDELAGALQAAARAGDAQAYHELLRPSGTFTAEGANFAADLGRVPQPTSTYLFSELRADGPRTRAQLSLGWERQPGQVSRVSLPVSLFKDGEVWRYGGEAFVSLPAGGFTLDVLDLPDLPQRAAPVAPLLPQAAAQVASSLGLQVPSSATVKVYPDMAALSASVALSLQPVGGWNEPGEAIKLVLPGGANFETELLRVLSHEFTHLSVSAAAGEGQDRRVPWWLHEGLADFVAQAYWTPGAAQSRWARVTGYARNDWVPLSELTDFNAVPESQWKYVYAQGLGVADYLAETRGKQAPLQLALAFAAAGQADGAARALGFGSFADLEGKARVWLAARQAPTSYSSYFVQLRSTRNDGSLTE